MVETPAALKLKLVKAKYFVMLALVFDRQNF
jgi:hypothetical protein